MIQLVHKVAHLILKASDFAVTLSQLLLFAFEIECFLVNQSVQLLYLVESFGDFKF